MSSECTEGSRGDRRAQSERRLVVLGVVTVLVVAVPELRAAAIQLLVGVVTLLVLLGLLGVLALAVAWRVARRHPVADLVVGAWLLRRHERRQQQVVDARSWSRVEQPYETRSWPSGSRARRW
jgi:hypothetical protein